MAQRKREAKLDSRSSRAGLTPSGKPYYRLLRPKLHLGYRKGRIGSRWVARVYLGNGRYLVETIASADDRADSNGTDVLTYVEAQRAAELIFSRMTGIETRNKRLTVATILEDYFLQLEFEGRCTRDARNRANMHILPKIGHYAVSELTSQMIRNWMKEVAETPARVRTRANAACLAYRTRQTPDSFRQRRSSTNRTLTILKAALNRAWREGLVSDDKAWRSVRRFGQVDFARIRYLQIEEARRLLDTSEPGFRNLVHAALQTGCRYGELRALRVGDFNKDAGTISVSRSKSGKSRHVILTEEGVLFFASITADRKSGELMLPNVKRRSRAAMLAAKKRREFTDDGAWRRSEQGRAMARACAEANLEPPANFHSLRHTWASHSVMAGVPLLVVAQNLGHADTRMVERHYGHLAPSYVADAIRKGAPRFHMAGSQTSMDFGAPLSANTQFDNLDDEAGLNRHNGIEELLESRTYRHQEATLEACLPLLSRLMIQD